MGDALVSIVYMTYYNGSTDVPTSDISSVVLSPVKRGSDSTVEQVVTLYIRCNSTGDTINNLHSSVSDGTTGNFTLSVRTNPGTISGQQYTHIMTIAVKKNMFDFNRDLVQAGRDMLFYTGQQITFSFDYKKVGATAVTIEGYPVTLKVGPVINLVNENVGSSYMSSAPGTSHTIRVYGEEQYKNGSAINWWIGGNGDSFPSGNIGTVNITPHFIVESSDVYSTYFENMVQEKDSDNNFTGNYIFTRKNDSAMPIGNLVVEINAAGQTYVGSKQTSVRVEDYMNIVAVKWHDGSSMNTETNINNALLSPVRKDEAMKIFVKFRSGHGLDFTKAKYMYATTIDYRRQFNCTVAQTSGSISQSYDLELTISTTPMALSGSTWSETWGYGMVSDNTQTRWFYTGQPISFSLYVEKTAGGMWDGEITTKLGPVIAIHNTVANGRFADYEGYPTGESFGGYLKPETGQKIVLQSRAKEWYLDTTNNTIADTGNDAVGASALNDRTRRGRQYVITWQYNNTGLTETASGSRPNVDSSELVTGETSYQYTREFRDSGHHLRVQHAASWSAMDSAGTAGATGRYYKDSGAWRVYVENGDGLDEGKLTALVTLSDSVSTPPEISIHHWYDGGKTTTLSVIDSAAQITSVRVLHYANGESAAISKSSRDEVWSTSSSGPFVIPSTMHGEQDIEITIYVPNENSASNVGINWGDAAGYFTGSIRSVA